MRVGLFEPQFTSHPCYGGGLLLGRTLIKRQLMAGMQASIRPRRLPIKITLAIILSIAAVLTFEWVFAPPEPEYKGRKISEWLANYRQFKQRDWREVDAAMRSFGTNGIPYILDDFSESRSFWQEARMQIWMRGPARLRDFLRPSFTQPFDTSYAPEIFGAIGPDSIPVLIETLRDRSPTKQLAAARGLSYFGSLATNALPEMHRLLASTPTNSRSYFLINNAIAQIEPKSAP